MDSCLRGKDGRLHGLQEEDQAANLSNDPYMLPDSKSLAGSATTSR